METIRILYIEVILDNGKGNGNYYLGSRVGA